MLEVCGLPYIQIGMSFNAEIITIETSFEEVSGMNLKGLTLGYLECIKS